jgi:hypothetical protein
MHQARPTAHNIECRKKGYAAARIQVKNGTRPEWSLGGQHPSDKDRCTATSKRTGQRCKKYAHPKRDGSGERARTCYWHGGPGAIHGKKAWRKQMRWDPKTGTHRKVNVKVGDSRATERSKAKALATRPLKAAARAARRWARL